MKSLIGNIIYIFLTIVSLVILFDVINTNEVYNFESLSLSLVALIVYFIGRDIRKNLKK
jgi:hypothetical protein